MASNVKNNRNYRLTIQRSVPVAGFSVPAQLGTFKYVANIPQYVDPTTAIQIDYPLTIDFDIYRFIGTAANELHIRVINLAEKTYTQIAKDPFNNQYVGNGGKFNQIQLQAGYGKNLTMIFVGEILSAYSERIGTETITHIYAVTGAYGRYNTFINQTFEAGTKNTDIINGVIAELEKSGTIKKGAITAVDGIAQTGFKAQGDAFNILARFGPVFVDLGYINILKVNEILGKFGGAQDIFVIDSDSGLLGTPIRRQTMLEVRVIFQPQVKLGQLVQISSVTDKRYNGQYKVMGIEHKGIISGSINGPLVTTLQLFLGNAYTGTFQTILPA